MRQEIIGEQTDKVSYRADMINKKIMKSILNSGRKKIIFSPNRK